MVFYSVLPGTFKTPNMDLIFGVLEYIPVHLTICAFSCVNALPAMLAFCIRETLNNFTLTVQTKDNSVEFVLSKCCALQLSLQQLNRTLSSVLLIHNLTAGLQQAVEIYVGFKMLQYNLPSTVLFSLLMDLGVIRDLNNF